LLLPVPQSQPKENLMMIRHGLVVGAAWALASSASMALEPLKIYDKFSSSPINGKLWIDGERSSQVKGGTLVLSERLYAIQASNTGYHYDVFRTEVTDPAAVTELKATVLVNALEVNACAANSTVTSSRARIAGAFFNVGNAVAGTRINDVIAQARVIRFSNSTDPAGVLQVTGQVIQCLDADCNSSTVLQSVSLGTTTIGTPVTLEMQWDQANKQFLFTRDNGSPVAAPYAVSDVAPPTEPYKDVDLRVDVANCTSAPPLTGFVNASFDNVFVNKSAAP
jgi:hypothetical protein